MLEVLHFSSVGAILGTLVALWSVSLVMRGVWRLYFSPIAKFPGPKLAALTYWYAFVLFGSALRFWELKDQKTYKPRYEFYYDIICRGQYVFQIQKLHQKYGPIIRINPHELHIIDPAFYDTLYAGAAGGKKRDRDVWHTNSMGIPDTVLTTVSHDLHRKRRAALSPFFSKQNIALVLGQVQENVDLLVRRLASFKGTGQVVSLEHALNAYTNGNPYHFSEEKLWLIRRQTPLLSTVLGTHIIGWMILNLIRATI